MEEAALGLVETRGLVPAIEAGDAMLKGAPVRLVRTEVTKGALVTVLVTGSVAAVTAAVEIGARAAGRTGEVVAHHVIPNPYDDVRELLHMNDPRSDGTPYAEMTVQQLRSLARSRPDIPLTGRAIAHARKSDLVRLLQEHVVD